MLRNSRALWLDVARCTVTADPYAQDLAVNIPLWLSSDYVNVEEQRDADISMGCTAQPSRRQLCGHMEAPPRPAAPPPDVITDFVLLHAGNGLDALLGLQDSQRAGSFIPPLLTSMVRTSIIHLATSIAQHLCRRTFGMEYQ
jgi:hypothetical protein